EQAYQSLVEALVEKILLQHEGKQLNFNLASAYIALGESLIAIAKKTNLEPQQNNENFNYKFSQFCHIFGKAFLKVTERKPMAYSQPKETQQPKKLFFDKTISLGSFCMPAHQIRKHLKQKEAYVFDWWVTPHQSLLKLVAEDFSKVFNKENLQLVKASNNNIYLVGDRYYGHRHDHDFPRYDKNNPEMLQYAGESVLENWKFYLPQAIEKCEFLLQRWRETLSNNRRILFVRVEYQWNPQKAIELRNLFLKNYPQIAPHFLFVGEAESPYDLREDWKLEKITTFHLPPPNYLNPPIPLPMGQIPPIDSGAEAWEQIFNQLNSVNSEEELPSHVLAEPVKIAGDRFFDRKTILMDANLQGEGWFAAEYYQEKFVRWMKETGTIITEISVAKPLQIEVEGLLATNQDFVEGMRVKVSDRLVDNATIKWESDRSWIFKGVIPTGAIDPNKPCVISIESPGVQKLSPKDLRTGSLLVTQVILKALE
ncbi:MAG: hypothetical protein F6K35_19160, partial [Okeania sp. SIO2H7]|nr:hypothetical protein [Okeania sp. SIO2H7]